MENVTTIERSINYNFFNIQGGNKMFGIGNVAINAQFRYMHLYEQYRRSYEGIKKEDIIAGIMSMNPLEKLLAHIHETMLPSETRAKYVAARDVLKNK